MEDYLEFEGIEFELPEGGEGNEVLTKYAKELAEGYDSKKMKIAKYLAEQEAIKEMYDDPTPEQIVEAMEGVRVRIFDERNCVLEFVDWGLDDEHIVSLECEGVFEKFAEHGVTIDG